MTDTAAEPLRYNNPVSEFSIGDVVRIGSGTAEWTIAGKGATTGLSLRNALGRKRSSSTFDVTLVRRTADSEAS